MRSLIKVSLGLLLSASWVTDRALAENAIVGPHGPEVEASPPEEASSQASNNAPPPAFSAAPEYPKDRIGGIIYEMKPAGDVGKTPPPQWYGDPKKLQPNAPVLVPTEQLLPATGDEEQIAKCERIFSMIWAARTREIAVGKVGELPPGIYRWLVDQALEFVTEMQLVCGNAARLPDEQEKNSSFVPGRPGSECRSERFLQLLEAILKRDPVVLNPHEREQLRLCSAWAILDEAVK